ncbi:MAG: LysM peptidoglycan-binding domain-containing protein [Gammaproteobacteria bacterium]|nr:MAG: LysM peptidoglycan-binding domain-containing protein [Gammaproteobacteria bacterium]
MSPLAPIRISLPSLTRIGVLCTLAVLSGCASYPDWRFGGQDAVETVAPSDRFLLPADGSDLIGDVQVTVAHHHDTLHDIARRYDLGYQEIVAANPGVDPWLPGQGTRVILPTQFVLPKGKREGLILNLASMRLFYFPKPGDGEAPVVITHPIGIGREGWQTPEGPSYITQKVVRPSWTVPASVLREYAEKGEPLEPIVPPGPDNPLGSHAMRLSLPGYLIHGTNKSYGVGMRVSHGCVRLYPEDIARLFPEVPLGTRVRIINEPYLTGWRDGRLYLDAHKPLSEQAAQSGKKLVALEQALAVKAAYGKVVIDWAKARKVANEARGIPVPISTGSPDLAGLLARAPQVPSEPYWAAADYADL